MQQPHVREVTLYAYISEVRTATRAAACNQLLAEGLILLGIYPLTTVGEMAQGRSGGEQERNSPRTPSGMCGG
jgi:hypothetical protein